MIRTFRPIGRLLRFNRVQSVNHLSISKYNDRNNCSTRFAQLNGIPVRRSIYTSQRLFADGDSHTVKCPAFAESVSEGDITWEKEIGDFVNEDEQIASIETDKTSMSVLAPVSGVLAEIKTPDGETVTPGTELCSITESGAKKSTPKPTDEAKPKADTKPKETLGVKKESPIDLPKEKPVIVSEKNENKEWTTKEIPKPSKNEDLQVRPATAKSDSVPLVGDSSPVTGHKSEGSRTESRVKMTRMRKKIAERLKDAQNTAASLTTFNEVDMSNIMDLRKKFGEAFLKKHNVKLGLMSPFVKASALALQDQPSVNAFIDGEDIVYRDFVDISIAVATPKGLVVPVLRNAETMNFAQIELSINSLGERARNNALSVEDMEGGTFTISNGGVFGSLFGTPIINPPQSAILGLHGIFERPIVVPNSGGKIEARPMMYIALTYDHRLVDGREAVTFLRKIKSFVEDPRTSLIDL